MIYTFTFSKNIEMRNLTSSDYVARSISVYDSDRMFIVFRRRANMSRYYKGTHVNKTSRFDNIDIVHSLGK